MAENDKYVARVPIVPDDFANTNVHKNHELVMDWNNDDIYVKKDNGYVNITGKIKEDVKEIKDGSAVIHIVTESTAPPVKDREANHWYFIITRSETQSSSETVSTANYIYYGLVKNYSLGKNYILIAQNVIDGPGNVIFELLEGYTPCVYIPIIYGATFTNVATGEEIEYEIADRLYALNTSIGSYTTYDVYLLNLTDPGEYTVKIDLTGSEYHNINFDTNESSIEGLQLPDTMKVRKGDCIGHIDDPTWNDPRFIFKGYSTSKISPVLIDPTVYKPEESMTLFAWFDYESDTTLLTYFATYNSTGNS